MSELRALTIRQPWASLIAAGAKTIETRSWRTSYRGPVLIHAGAHVPVVGEDVGDSGWYWEPDELGPSPLIINWKLPHWVDHPAPLGAVVAVADLVDCRAIVDVADQRDEPLIITGWVDGGLRRWDFPGGIHRIDDQLPLGDFTTGRWAWLLDNIRPLTEPVPAKGRQGLWRPDPDLTARCEAVARD